MSDAQKTLCGIWRGEYAYPISSLAPVAFNAILTEGGGRLAGEIVEPNTLSQCIGAGELFASLEGDRAGDAVEFVKTYEPSAQVGHRLRYEGRSNAQLTQIRGLWRIVGRGPGEWSGPFVMDRVSGAESVARALAGRRRLPQPVDGR